MCWWNILTAVWLGLFLIQLHTIDGVIERDKDLGCLGSNCYSLYGPPSAADYAKNECLTIGGIMAAVKNTEILHFLAEAMNTNELAWIGLSRRYSTSWVFSDGTGVHQTALNPMWIPPRLSASFNHGGNCVSLYKRYLFDDNCYFHHKFICQIIRFLPCDTGDLSLPNSLYENCLNNTMIEGGKQIKVDCFSGYAAKYPDDWYSYLELRTTFNVTCHNVTWRQYPQCVSVCYPPPFDPHTISIFPRRPFYFFGDNITLVCDDGYFTNREHPVSHMILVCFEENQWEPSSYSLDCVLASKFIFAHKQFEEVLIEVEVGQEVMLDCNGKKDALNTSETTYGWFRDQHDIRSLVEMNYTVLHSNGSLLLHSFNASDEGMYSCYYNNTPGSLAYKIKGTLRCNNTTHTFNIVVTEFSSPKIMCPEYDSLRNMFPPMWYKDGMRILGNEKFNILSNGVLFISNITLSDNGRYTCKVLKEGGFCAKNYTILVSITAATDTCGRITNLKDIPWLVSLWWVEDTVPFCYGARISEHWVVTSAFCLYGLHRRKRPDFFVQLGSTSGTTGNSSHLLPVESVKIYPFYSRRTNFGDIGLIKLRYAINFWKKDHIYPLCLVETDVGPLKNEHSACEQPKPLKGTSSGWGNLETASEKATQKREELAVRSPEECQFFSSNSSAVDCFFCASGVKSSLEPAGDSGSPFAVEWMGQLVLYGIFSWGERASMVGKYDFYTKVSCYTKWITEQLKNNYLFKRTEENFIK